MSRHYLNPRLDRMNHPYINVATLWSLKIIISLNGFGRFKLRSLEDELLLQAVDLEYLLFQTVEKKELLQIVKKQLYKYESMKPEIQGDLRVNINKFGEQFGLSEVEMKVLQFAVVINIDRGLSATADLLNNPTNSETFEYLSILLGIPVHLVRKALSSTGILSKAGILRLGRRGTLVFKLDLIDNLADVLMEPLGCQDGLLNSYFQLSEEATLMPDDMSYIKKEFKLIKKFVARAVREQLSGVNILIHGKPGAGKSELARILARSLRFELYEISYSDRNDVPLTGSERFKAYRLSQQALRQKKKALILFDEIEDVFEPQMGDIFMPRQDKNKAWVNRLLEKNPVPALWVSNDISMMDKAYLRRFDFILELEYPKQASRKKIFEKHLANLEVSPQWVEHLSANQNIAPALISRASRVVGSLNTRSIRETESSLEMVLGNTMQAMGYSGSLSLQNHHVLSYRLDALNPDCNLQQLVKGLNRHGAGRLCLYGPPGTGKTGFGHYVSSLLGQPLLIKRASDLLGKYVGENERNISSMFREARQNSMILMLDEADSFLQDRRQAKSQWQVTLVNELLTQMEVYEGIFICSTNLMENLDAASLRRFDYKIYFDYLQPDQSWLLFRQVLQDQGVKKINGRLWKSELSRLQNLTPGDFAAVIRQSRFQDKALGPEELLHGLSAEVRYKSAPTCNRIGFTANI